MIPFDSHQDCLPSSNESWNLKSFFVLSVEDENNNNNSNVMNLINKFISVFNILYVHRITNKK